MQNTQYTVGKLARRCDCKVETVRYYEKIALMPEPPRTEGGHRLYTLEHVKRLNFIRRSRGLGFSIEQVRGLLQFIDESDHTCGEVQAMAEAQISQVEEKIIELQRLQQALETISARCGGGEYSIDDCPVIDALFDMEQSI